MCIKWKYVISITLLVLSSGAHARKNCPVAKIDHIQIESGVILYFQSGVWRRLGVISDVGTKERYSALLAAQMSGKNVMIAYRNDDYDCHKTNYGESSYIVRTYN